MPSEQVAPQSAESPRKPDGNGKATGVIKDYVAVARGSDLVVIRVIGKGTMLTAPALADFAEQQRKTGFSRFVFDLQRCSGLDSTFMGVMVGMQTAPRPESGQHPAPRPATPAPVAAQDSPGSAPNAAPVEPMSPEEAVAALRKLFANGLPADAVKAAPGDPPAGQTKAADGLVSAVNVPPEIASLMAMLGVDKFVRIRGTYDLRQLETTILPEKSLVRDELHRLILKAHSALIEIDKRNEARFGPFLKSLSQALAGEK